MNEEKNSSKWHVERRIPIGVIVGLILGVLTNYGILVWYASKVSSLLEKDPNAVVLLVAQLRGEVLSIKDLLTRLENQVNRMEQRRMEDGKSSRTAM